MRNLKKILALVLALVMSLSLMATAGAAETTSASSAVAYATAAEVLQGLKVLEGYPDGQMHFEDPFTRPQAAAVFYRVDTKDVTNANKDLYTNAPFTDVGIDHWARGYIAYCYDNKIVKGMGDGSFGDKSPLTGYQVLVMALRELGYGQNNEFDGDNYQIKTASTATQIGLLDGVTPIDQNRLGQPATRGLMAQIVFNMLLQDTVRYNALYQNYESDGNGTLGYQKFTLEEVKGVVVANEYADIRYDKDDSTVGAKPVAADTTVLRDKDGKDRTLDIGSTLDDLGESRVVYTVENGNKRNSYSLKCLTLADSGNNNVTYDGGEKLSSLSSYVTGSSGAEHFVNFGRTTGSTTTSIKVSYRADAIYDVVNGIGVAGAIKAFEAKYYLSGLTEDDFYYIKETYFGSGVFGIIYMPQAGHKVNTDTTKWPSGHTYTIRKDVDTGRYYYYVEIEPKATFNAVDDSVVESIFDYADWTEDIPTRLVVVGEVYRGTQSRTDYSDTHSYEEFRVDCLNEPEDNTSVTSNQKGWWLKVIDYDNDGYTDYIFQTRYTVATVDSVSASGVPTLETENITGSTETDTVNNMSRASSTVNEGEDLEEGDVVYYAVIDGVARVWKAKTVDVRVDTIDRNNLKITTADGADYEESGVHEHSALPTINSGVVNMSGKTNYILYLDKYDYLAAFSQNIAGNFVLLADGWARTIVSGTEYIARTWDKDNERFVNYNITSGGSLFIDNSSANSNSNSWGNIKKLGYDPTTLGQLNNDGTDIRTAVAYVETDGENATLAAVDTVYDVLWQNDRMIEMIDMNKTIPGSNSTSLNGTIYRTNTNGAYYVKGEAARVRALASTMYYYVYDTNGDNSHAHTDSTIVVRQFKGYSNGANFLTATQRAKYVEDVYAVGTRTEHVTANGGSEVYYTANVVVVELNDDFYADHNDMNEVFIYDFPVVSNYVTVENVKAIDWNGNQVDLDIDLSLSNYRVYDWSDTKTGVNHTMPAPGLYYLHRTSKTDSDGIYAISAMTHEDIRKSGHYDVGTVSYSFGTYEEDYAHINDWICGNAYLQTDNPLTDKDYHTNAYANRVYADALSSTSARKDLSTSQYYTLSYGTGNYAGYSATLGTGESGSWVLREKYDPTYTYYAEANLNQVLVRWSSSGIVYAISFAHKNGTAENYAQQVWRSALMDQPKTANNLRSIRIALQGNTSLIKTVQPDIGTTTDNLVKAIDYIKLTPVNGSGTYYLYSDGDGVFEGMIPKNTSTFTIAVELKPAYATSSIVFATYPGNKDDVTDHGDNTATLVLDNTNSSDTVYVYISASSVINFDPEKETLPDTIKNEKADLEKWAAAQLSDIEDDNIRAIAQAEVNTIINALDFTKCEDGDAVKLLCSNARTAITNKINEITTSVTSGGAASNDGNVVVTNPTAGTAKVTFTKATSLTLTTQIVTAADVTVTKADVQSDERVNIVTVTEAASLLKAVETGTRVWNITVELKSAYASNVAAGLAGVYVNLVLSKAAVTGTLTITGKNGLTPDKSSVSVKKGDKVTIVVTAPSGLASGKAIGIAESSGFKYDPEKDVKTGTDANGRPTKTYTIEITSDSGTSLIVFDVVDMSTADAAQQASPTVKTESTDTTSSSTADKATTDSAIDAATSENGNGTVTYNVEDDTTGKKTKFGLTKESVDSLGNTVDKDSDGEGTDLENGVAVTIKTTDGKQIDTTAEQLATIAALATNLTEEDDELVLVIDPVEIDDKDLPTDPDFNADAIIPYDISFVVEDADGNVKEELDVDGTTASGLKITLPVSEALLALIEESGSSTVTLYYYDADADVTDPADKYTEVTAYYVPETKTIWFNPPHLSTFVQILRSVLPSMKLGYEVNFTFAKDAVTGVAVGDTKLTIKDGSATDTKTAKYAITKAENTSGIDFKVTVPAGKEPVFTVAGTSGTATTLPAIKGSNGEYTVNVRNLTAYKGYTVAVTLQAEEVDVTFPATLDATEYKISAITKNTAAVTDPTTETFRVGDVVTFKVEAKAPYTLASVKKYVGTDTTGVAVDKDATTEVYTVTLTADTEIKVEVKYSLGTKVKLDKANVSGYIPATSASPASSIDLRTKQTWTDTTVAEGKATVNLVANGMPVHMNPAEGEGAWVGFMVYLATDDYSTPAAWTKAYYTSVRGGKTTPTELDMTTMAYGTGHAGDMGVAFYYDAANTTSDTVTVYFSTADGVVSETYTFTVNISGTKAGAKEQAEYDIDAAAAAATKAAGSNTAATEIISTLVTDAKAMIKSDGSNAAEIAKLAVAQLEWIASIDGETESVRTPTVVKLGKGIDVAYSASGTEYYQWTSSSASDGETYVIVEWDDLTLTAKGAGAWKIKAGDSDNDNCTMMTVASGTPTDTNSSHAVGADNAITCYHRGPGGDWAAYYADIDSGVSQLKIGVVSSKYLANGTEVSKSGYTKTVTEVTFEVTK